MADSLKFISTPTNLFIVGFITLFVFIILPIMFITFNSYGVSSEQVKILSDRYDQLPSKNPVSDILNNPDKLIKLFSKENMPPSEQCFVNFYSLACRFSGFIGPMDEGYWDPETSIRLAVKAGCRTFVLEIDYMDECMGDTISYYPRIAIRDVQGRLRINYESDKPACNSGRRSNIRDVCGKINDYAFSSSCTNNTDPVIIVLYFLRQPPGAYNSTAVLDYYSNVAKGLSCFKNRFLTNELDGGTYYRQTQQSKILINNIKDYYNKVLIFSNANTSGFRTDKSHYASDEDLDFLVNLCLKYNPPTNSNIIDNSSNFGVLSSVEDYLQIPADRSYKLIEDTKLRWTLCLSSDPSIPVSKPLYNTITSQYGINCVPIVLFDFKNDFMFTANLFKKYSFIPKPKSLRYIKAGDVIPQTPVDTTVADVTNVSKP